MQGETEHLIVVCFCIKSIKLTYNGEVMSVQLHVLPLKQLNGFRLNLMLGSLHRQINFVPYHSTLTLSVNNIL